LRDQVIDSEQKVIDYRQAHGLTSSRGTTVTTQELAEINAQLAAAHADYVQRAVALRRAREELAGTGEAEGVREVLLSPTMQRLRDQEAALLQRTAELSTTYRPSHPTMVKMAAELVSLRRKIADEADRVVRTMTEEVSVARAREETLKANLAELTRFTAGQESGQRELRELEHEADTSRVLYESLLTRLKQTTAQEDMQQPDAQIISRAKPPTSSSGHSKRQLLATTGGLSLLWGFLVALAIDGFDPTFRRSDEVEQLTRIPVLGIVPSVEPARPGRMQRLVPETLLAEALLAITSGLRLAQAGTPTGVVLITSPAGDDGKTFFAVALGRNLAGAGFRCLLIDCHFQRPGVGAMLASNGIGPHYPNIQVDKPSGLHYILAPTFEQRRAFRSQRLFESAEMRTYIQRMRGHYDLIILDAPPVAAMGDLVALSRLTDATLLLCRWGRTPRHVLLTTIRSLGMRGVNIAGIVFSRVNLRRYATYGYGDYVGYLREAADPRRAA